MASEEFQLTQHHLLSLSRNVKIVINITYTLLLIESRTSNYFKRNLVFYKAFCSSVNAARLRTRIANLIPIFQTIFVFLLQFNYSFCDELRFLSFFTSAIRNSICPLNPSERAQTKSDATTSLKNKRGSLNKFLTMNDEKADCRSHSEAIRKRQ